MDSNGSGSNMGIVLPVESHWTGRFVLAGWWNKIRKKFSEILGQLWIVETIATVHSSV